MSEKQEMIAKRITIPKTLHDRAEKAIEDGCFPGVRSLSGLIEKGLHKLLEDQD